VVIESNLRNIVGNLLSLLPFRKIRCVTWGIGVSASLDKKFNQDRKWDFLRLLLYRHADSVIFYSAPAANHFTSKGLASKKVFVAENTVSVNYSNYKTFVRDKFIFLGSLYPQKGLEELMLAYSLYLEKVRNPISLFIIGEGSDRGSIEAWIAANSLEDLVTMLGEVREEVALEYYIRTALCCISPRQAGLSVLKSIGYGTPFVTRRDAVTGGELFNIIHRFNGLLYDRTEELVNILIDATVFPGNYEAMGSNGRDYYLENCSIDMFVSSFLGAFEVATSSKPQLSP
jgi:glycosyltransferase involved in cell wall biosynthesis